MTGLNHKGPAPEGPADTGGTGLTIRIEWEPELPVLSAVANWRRAGDSADGQPATLLPLRSRTADGQPCLMLPGSSIKGVLRSQAERIMRTVLHAPEPAPPSILEPKQVADFDRDIAVPLVGSLFGRPPAADGTGALKGVLTVSDCVSALTETENAHIDALAAGAPDGCGGGGQEPSGLVRSTHVAIDRWLGSAADGRLFSRVEPFGRTWTPLILRFDPPDARLSSRDWLASVGLLLLVLDDLAAGMITLGHGGNRGLGAVRVLTIAVDGTLPSQAVISAPVRTLADPGLAHQQAAPDGGALIDLIDDVAPTLMAAVKPAWQEALCDLDKTARPESASATEGGEPDA